MTRKLDTPPLPPPPPVRAEIFAYYNDAGEMRYADPHRVQRTLHAAVGGSLSQRVAAANDRDGDPRAYAAAWDCLCNAVVAAFELNPFDRATGKGAGDEFCQELLTRFFDFQAAVKKKRESSQTASRPTAPPTSLATPRSNTGCG